MKINLLLVSAALAISLGFLTGCQSRRCCCCVRTQAHQRPLTHIPHLPQWTSNEVAAKNSMEGKLRSEGQRWVRNPGEITVGAYVQDILEGRLDQPKGRGAIGKVVSLLPSGTDGKPGAMVDFGRDYTVPINLSELALVRVAPKD